MKKYVAVLGLLAMGVGAFASDITIYDGISDNNYYNPTDNSVYSSNPGAPAAQWYGEGNFDVSPSSTIIFENGDSVQI